VQESNKGWFALHLSELQKTTSLWEEQGKPEGLLFLGGSLKRARVWANKNRPLTTTEEEFLAASVNKNRSKQLQIAVFCTVIALAIGATVGGIGAWRESIQAHKALAQSSVAIVRDILKEKSGPEMALAYLSTAVSNDPCRTAPMHGYPDCSQGENGGCPKSPSSRPPILYPPILNPPI